MSLDTSNDKPWFDDDYREAFETKQSSCCTWCRDRPTENWDAFMVSGLAAEKVHDAVKMMYNRGMRERLYTSPSSH